MRIIKNILTIYLIVLSYNTLHAQEKHNRTKEEYHPNGKIKAIITYDNNGFWNGPLITYYPSGDIEAIRFYAPLNSNLKEIEHSQILTLEEKIYKSYLGRVGIHTYYYSKHILRKIELYSCGKLHGITVEFQPSMTLSYYKNGIYKGAKKFDDDGRIIRDGMEISSTYETLKLLNSLVAQTPEVINESYFWDYLYYSKVTDELFTGHWYDLSNLGRIFDRLDKSTYKNQMDSEQKQFWEKKRYAYRSLLIQQIYKPIYNTDLLYIFPQYEGNFLFREVLLMAEEATQNTAKDKRFLQLEEAIDKLRSLNLDVLQEEELSTLEEDMIKAKNMGDQNQKAERLKSALIDYLKENKYTSESLYQLADKALNSNMLATDINKTLVLFADGFLEYLYNRRNELENSSDLITEYDYLLLAYGGLILNNRRALLSYDVDYKLVYKIVTEIKNKYNIQCTISTDKDLKKLSHEFKFKSAPFKSIMIK